jgi:hypothetical protein
MENLTHLTGQYIIIHALIYVGLKGAHTVMSFIDAERHQLIERHLKDGHAAKFSLCDHLDCSPRKKTEVSFVEA